MTKHETLQGDDYRKAANDREVEAENRMEAERLVHDKWNKGDFILDAECFKGVDFKAVMPERERGAR